MRMSAATMSSSRSAKPVWERAQAHNRRPGCPAQQRVLCRPRFMLLLYLNLAWLAMRK